MAVKIVCISNLSLRETLIIIEFSMRVMFADLGKKMNNLFIECLYVKLENAFYIRKKKKKLHTCVLMYLCIKCFFLFSYMQTARSRQAPCNSGIFKLGFLPDVLVRVLCCVYRLAYIIIILRFYIRILLYSLSFFFLLLSLYHV